VVLWSISLVSWDEKLATIKDALLKFKEGVDYVQGNPVLNRAARTALSLVPAGNVLVEYWDSYADSKTDDPTDQIVETLKTMEQMDEARLEEFSKELKSSRDEILHNRGYLKTLVDQSSKILYELSSMKEQMVVMQKNQEMMLRRLGIETQIKPGQEVNVSEQQLKDLDDRDREIERLRAELEKRNQAPELDIDYVIKNGNAHYYAGEYDEAIVLYDLVLKVDPRQADALNNKGLALNNLGRCEEAVFWLDRVLKIDPKDVAALNNKGLALTGLGRYEDAISWFDKALKIDSKYVAALSNKGFALNNLGRYEDAIPWFDEALKIDPKQADTLNNKGLALAGLRMYAKAISCFDEVLEIDSKYVAALSNKGFALTGLGRYAEAIPWFDEALKIDAKHLAALNNKGLALAGLGRHEEAISWLDRALMIDPKRVDTLNIKRFCLEQLEK
jgi:tetratricopeptide (TPR) repeat protein